MGWLVPSESLILPLDADLDGAFLAFDNACVRFSVIISFDMDCGGIFAPNCAMFALIMLIQDLVVAMPRQFGQVTPIDDFLFCWMLL